MARPKKIVHNREVSKISLAKYVAVTPNLSKNSDVIFFNRNDADRDNSFLEYLLDLSDNTSSTHSNLLALKKDLTYGKGFVTDDPATQDFLDNINPNQDGNDILDTISDDFSVFEATVLQIVWSADGSRPANVYHVDVQKIRCEEADEFGHIHGYWMKDNWLSNNRVYSQSILKNLQQTNQNPLYIPVFNPNKAKEVYTENDPETAKNPDLIGSLKQPVQILYIKKPNTGQPYYAVPSYASAINYIELEKNLGVFHNASVSNGFFPSLIINPVGSPTPEERQKYLTSIINSFSGAENASKAFIEFIEKAGDETKVTPITVNNNADLYNALTEIALYKIASAHRASPELAGAITKGADMGGDANKLSVAYHLFYNNVIKGYQATILKAFNKVLKAGGLKPVEIVNEHPLFLIDQGLVKDNLTKDEIREKFFGLKPLPPTSQTPQA